MGRIPVSAGSSQHMQAPTPQQTFQAPLSLCPPLHCRQRCSSLVVCVGVWVCFCRLWLGWLCELACQSTAAGAPVAALGCGGGGGILWGRLHCCLVGVSLHCCCWNNTCLWLMVDQPPSGARRCLLVKQAGVCGQTPVGAGVTPARHQVLQPAPRQYIHTHTRTHTHPQHVKLGWSSAGAVSCDGLHVVGGWVCGTGQAVRPYTCAGHSFVELSSNNHSWRQKYLWHRSNSTQGAGPTPATPLQSKSNHTPGSVQVCGATHAPPRPFLLPGHTARVWCSATAGQPCIALLC